MASSEVTLVLPIEFVYVLIIGMISTLGMFIRIELRTRSQALDIKAIRETEMPAIRKCITNIERRVGAAEEHVEEHHTDLAILKDRTKRSAV